MIEKFALAPLGDYDFYVGGEMYSIGCFSWFDDDLLDGISAAAISSMTGSYSLDNIRKNFSGNRSSFADHDGPAKSTLATLEKHLVSSYNEMKPRNGSPLGEIVFDQAIVRALTTVKNVLFLARRGYIFETALVARGALEQIAWARAASRATSEKELFEINPRKEISAIKKTIPWVGRIYGQLSDYSHFNARKHFLLYTERNEEIAVRNADSGTKYLSMHWPFILSDILLIIFEELYRGKLSDICGLDEDGKLKEKRFPIEKMEEYFEGEVDVADLFT